MARMTEIYSHRKIDVPSSCYNICDKRMLQHTHTSPTTTRAATMDICALFRHFNGCPVKCALQQSNNSEL